MAKPKITYGGGPTTLTFNQFPVYQQLSVQGLTYVNFAPEADTNSTTEYVQTHIYMYDFAEIHCQAILAADLDSFYTWWDAVKDGTTFTYFPDATAGTNYTVMVDMTDFAPEITAGLYQFILRFRIIS